MNDMTRLIVFAALFAFGVSCCIVDGFVQMAMIGEVNRQLPEKSQIGYFGAHIGKALRVKNEYKRLYPDGKLLRIFNLLLLVSVVSAAGGAAVLFRIIG